MKPSVGRVVHYTGFGDEQHGACYAALITRVNDTYGATNGSGNVDLTVFPPSAGNDNPPPFTASDVTGGGNEPGHGQWHWPERVED